MQDLQAIADKLPGPTALHRGAVESKDGAAFPDGKHIALTRWQPAAKPSDQGKQRGNWQYCDSASGSVVKDFVDKWPNYPSA